MTFLSVLSTIESDIKKGLEVAAPFLTAAAAVPVIGPILTQVGIIITNLEQGGHTLDASTLSAIVQGVALVSAVKTVPPALVPKVSQ